MPDHRGGGLRPGVQGAGSARCASTSSSIVASRVPGSRLSAPRADPWTSPSGVALVATSTGTGTAEPRLSGCAMNCGGGPGRRRRGKAQAHGGGWSGCASSWAPAPCTDGRTVVADGRRGGVPGDHGTAGGAAWQPPTAPPTRGTAQRA
ncbi:hypothetical protein QJS66_14795 [Kocuria rhizophila]|nr:hypothetical protein QJS66_14795 [Kocuria rhizophila]